MLSARAARSRSAAVRWTARVGGTALLVAWFQHGRHELAWLVEEQSLYGERIFSLGFLAMLLGLAVGWLSDRWAAALLLGGCLLAVAAAALGTAERPMLAGNGLGVAIFLLPFLAVGIAYAFAGRTRAAFS